MQFTTVIFSLALAATSLAAPSAGGPSARSAGANTRRWCPSEVTIHTIAPDGSNNICYAPVNNDWKDISSEGPHPELSISAATWTDFDYVHCAFEGVDTKNKAGPVLSNIVDTQFGPGFQVGPPQTLTKVRCWCL